MEARIQNPQNNQKLSSIEWQRSEVYSIDPDAPLVEALRIMRQEKIGDVLILDRTGKGGVLGIITDRDIAMALADGDNLQTPVEKVMSADVVTASVNDDIFSIIRLMKDHGVSRIPMLDEKRNVLGIVSARNLIQLITSALFDLSEISEQQQAKVH